MKKHIKIILASLTSVALLIGCYPEMDELTADHSSDGGNVAIANFSNVTSSFFDLVDIDNAFVEFEIDSDGEKIESVTLMQTYKGVSVEVKTVTTLPATVKITSQEAATASGITVANFELGDVFTYETLVLGKNGKTYRSNAGVVSAGVLCKSNLAGTYDITVVAGWCGDPVATGLTVTLTEVVGGSYSVDDFSFGAYDTCYGGAPYPNGDLRINDLCNNISITGSSQWGEVYTWSNMVVSGNEWSFDWENDGGEKGSVIIINGDGDWPPLTL